MRRPGGRSARVRSAVYAAAIAELTEEGYAGVSPARIADRAGVHRTTVYRRWPDLDHLLAEALLDQADVAIPIPDTGNLRDDLRELLTEIAQFFDHPAGRQRLQALVAGAARSPQAAALASDIWLRRFELGTAVLTRAIERQHLRADIAATTLMECFLGPLYLRLLLTGEPIDDAFIDAIIDIGLTGVSGPGRDHS